MDERAYFANTFDWFVDSPTSPRSGSIRRRESSSCSRTPGWSIPTQPDPGNGRHQAADH